MNRKVNFHLFLNFSELLVDVVCFGVGVHVVLTPPNNTFHSGVVGIASHLTTTTTTNKFQDDIWLVNLTQL